MQAAGALRLAEVYSEDAAKVGKWHDELLSANCMWLLGMVALAVISMRFPKSVICCGVNMACASQDTLQGVSVCIYMRSPPEELHRWEKWIECSQKPKCECGCTDQAPSGLGHTRVRANCLSFGEYGEPGVGMDDPGISRRRLGPAFG